MARIRHSEVGKLRQLDEAMDSIHRISRSLGLASAPLKVYELTRYDYLFSNLQSDPDALLRPDKQTVQSLIALGETMNDPGTDPGLDSSIPAAYTYFGQFVNHDITLELQSEEIANLYDPDLKPFNVGTVREQIKNRRSPTLDLDSVYGTTADGSPVPRVCQHLVVGAVVDSEVQRPPGKDDFNDLPRKPNSDDPLIDREALIGDARNDENLIISQMHLAFLRAHNALVASGLTYRDAKKILTQHFQWIVIHDFLMRIVDREIVNDILRHGNKFYRPRACDLYMPLEFSVAAFRFGHSMVRTQYDYNINFQQATAATLDQLFTLGAFRASLADFRALPQHWIIQWENFLDGGRNKARRINTRLVDPLANLRGPDGQPLKGAKAKLAVRNLLRGYLLRMPTGQAVARALNLPALSQEQLEKVASSVSQDQLTIMRNSGFLKQTPLWYYILAEAANGSSNTLGKVGGTLVAEVLIGLIRWTEDSILSSPGWKPMLGSSPNTFNLKDLFSLANVWA